MERTIRLLQFIFAYEKKYIRPHDAVIFKILQLIFAAVVAALVVGFLAEVGFLKAYQDGIVGYISFFQNLIVEK